MMKDIGEELHRATGAFARAPGPGPGPGFGSGPGPGPGHHRRPGAPACDILDMCMAPGGFLAVALRHNPGARALAMSLPVDNGGHKVLLPRCKGVEKRFLDITMLAADMGVDDIPPYHPDAAAFLPRQLPPHRLFDLVLCDGHVLRTHARSPYRERREAVRLTTTQLALGLEHLRPGGTMVVLLHRLEGWTTVNLVAAFRGFARIHLYKPTRSHTTRSSFYMVAADVQSRHADAVAAVQLWKERWRVATFGSDDEYARSQALGQEEPAVEALLASLGPSLVEWGRDVWRKQAEALARMPWTQDREPSAVASADGAA